MAKVKKAALAVVSKPTNDWEKVLEQTEPYTATVRVRGTADLLFNRWSPEVVDGTSALPPGAHRVVTVPEELLVYRDTEGGLALPGEHFRGAIVKAGKFFKSPQNPRATMIELLKAGIVIEPFLIPFGTDRWDYLDTRRVPVNRARGAINKTRPAMRAGWELEFRIECLVPEYCAPERLNDIVAKAGRFCGVGDFRPTFGRFQVVGFAVSEDE